MTVQKIDSHFTNSQYTQTNNDVQETDSCNQRASYIRNVQSQSKWRNDPGASYRQDRRYHSGKYVQPYTNDQNISTQDISQNIQINKKIISAFTIDQIIDHCRDSLYLLNEINITTAIHRIAKLHKKYVCTQRQKDFVLELAQMAIPKIRNLESKALAGTAWAFATLDIKDDALFREIAQKASTKIRDFTPQELVNTAWAFATLDSKDGALFIKSALKISTKIPGLTSQR